MNVMVVGFVAFFNARASRWFLALMMTLAALAAGGCGDANPSLPVSIAPEGQAVVAGLLGRPLGRPLRFDVRGADRPGGAVRAMAGARVRFDVFSHPEGSAGTLEVAEAFADAGGQVAVGFSPGAKPGVYRVRARLVDAPEAVDAIVTVLGGVLVGGDGQDGWTGGGLPAAWTVRFETSPGRLDGEGRLRFTPLPGPVALSLSRTEPESEPEADGGGPVAATEVRLADGFGVGSASLAIMDSPLGPDAARYPLTLRCFAINPWPLAATVAGGLALFVFGMGLMSDGLQFLAGDRLKSLLNRLTSNRLAGVMIGAVVTALIQSSSACTVMVVGFVNAGLVTLKQAIGVIIGSNVGTTITAQLIAFKLDDLALPAVALGVLARILSKSRRGNYGGQILIGFGLLFLGLTLMGGTLQTLKDSALVRDLFASVSCEPDATGAWSVGAMLTAVALGAAVTMVVQSSSVTTGILIMLAGSGLLRIYTAFAILLGENIGTTVTAVMASANGTATAKRTALFHVLFNAIGVVVMVTLQFVPYPGTGRPLFMELVHCLTGGDNFRGENLPRFLANAHTMFNIATALYFIPFAGTAARLCERLVKDKPGEAGAPRRRALEANLLQTPSLAMMQVWNELAAMLRQGRGAYAEAAGALLNPGQPDWEKVSEEVRRQENEADEFQADVTTYLGQLSLSRLNERQGEALPLLLAGVDDVEKLGDYSRHIIKLARRVRKRSLPFSAAAAGEMRRIIEGVDGLFQLAEAALGAKDDPAPPPPEQRQALRQQMRDAARGVKNLASDFRKSHEARHEAGHCDIRSGVVFLDFMQTAGRVATHLSSLVRAAVNAED